MSSERVKAFGREVRRKRLALHMSLDALAKATKYTKNYLGEVEEDTRVLVAVWLTATTLALIATTPGRTATTSRLVRTKKAAKPLGHDAFKTHVRKPTTPSIRSRGQADSGALEQGE
jgi:transcriptional regulator with XRE-family HTH domain